MITDCQRQKWWQYDVTHMVDVVTNIVTNIAIYINLHVNFYMSHVAATSLLLTDFEDGWCWWQKADVRFEILMTNSVHLKSHQNEEKVTNNISKLAPI